MLIAPRLKPTKKPRHSSPSVASRSGTSARRSADMAKKSAIEKNKKRQKLVEKYAAKRAELKAVAMNEDLPLEERFKARLKLAELPRNSAANRVRNRCEVTGRPRGYYRKLKMSRIALRELGSNGQIPGLVKSSW